MAMTLYQKAYIKTLTGATRDTYINTVYDSYSDGANTTYSAYATERADRKLRVHAYTRKLTVLNGGTPA